MIDDKPKLIFEFGPISIWRRCIGRPFTIDIGNASFHLFPRPTPNHIWGMHNDWYDGPLRMFGLGPLLLICW
jgi:hypothetical protein